MRLWIAIALVAAQLGTLAFMAGEREWVLRSGRTIYLRTAPVDPRDPMRGDYVRFNYEVGHAPRRLWRDGIAGWASSDWREQRTARDRRVFAQVELDEEGVAQLVAVSDREPDDGIYLRGRVSSIHPEGLDMRLGVEALFMEQGKAKEFEQSRNARAGVPLNIEVAVSDRGLAVMKGYRWEPLGITLSFERAENARAVSERAAPPRRLGALRAVTVELKNHSDQPVAIVALPNAQSFRLVPNEGASVRDYRWVNENTPRPKPLADAVRVLAPGEAYRERIDFTDPNWWVHEVHREGGRDVSRAPTSWEELAGNFNASFRIEYVPPTRAEAAALPHAERLRHSRLRSRAFNPAGVSD